MKLTEYFKMGITAFSSGLYMCFLPLAIILWFFLGITTSPVIFPEYYISVAFFVLISILAITLNGAILMGLKVLRPNKNGTISAMTKE